VAAALRAKGLVVEVHSDHFPPDAPDTEWLAAVGKHHWIVLTKDKNIRKRELERRALNESGVHAFFLGQQGLSGMEMATIFAKAVPSIQTIGSLFETANPSHSPPKWQSGQN
jgi:hypothetical protein